MADPTPDPAPEPTPDRAPELMSDGAPDVVPDDPALERLRGLCALLPETAEIDALGRPTFRAGARGFASFEVVDGRPTVCVKTTPEVQATLVARPGFTSEPDTGHHGWTLVVADDTVDWDEIDELVVASYRLVAPAELVAQLDRLLGPG
jgi:predicted DNA-binding protein (MmcQ/YjbR family)